MNEVFSTYGHVVPRDVLLGGRMFFNMDEKTDVIVDESDLRTTIGAAVAIKTSDGGGGGGAALPPATESGSKRKT